MIEPTRDDLIAILRALYDGLDCGADHTTSTNSFRDGRALRGGCKNAVTHADRDGQASCPEHTDTLDHSGPIVDLRYDFEREA